MKGIDHLRYLKITSLLAILLGSEGCAIPPFKPQGIYRHATISIVIDDNIMIDGEKGQGTAQCGNAGKERFCILTLPSIDSLDDFDFYYWGKELAHVWGGNYHEGIEDIY